MSKDNPEVAQLVAISVDIREVETTECATETSRDSKDQNSQNINRRYTACLIATATAFLFADQNLMAPNLSQIAREFNMDPIEADQKLGGEIALALFVVGGPMSLLIGLLADKLNRVKLYASIIIFGEGGSLMMLFVKNYWQLFALRALTGIALGGALPLVFSLLSDMYPPSERNRVSALVGAAMSLGTLLGQLMAGAVGPDYGWRLPFVIVSIPSCLIALLFLFTATEPVRASQEDIEGVESYTEKITCKKVKDIFLCPSNTLIFIQGIPGCIFEYFSQYMPWGMLSVFLNDYLYSNNGAPSVFDATIIVTIYGVGGLFGQLLGGYWGQLLYNRNKELVSYLMGGTTIIGILPMLLLLDLPFSYWLSPVAFFGGLVASITGPNVRATLQNCNLPETRGTVFALFALTDDLGKAFGPYLISALVAGFGRKVAFNIATCMWLVCGIFLLSLGCTMRKDEEYMLEKMENSKKERRDCMPLKSVEEDRERKIELTPMVSLENSERNKIISRKRLPSCQKN